MPANFAITMDSKDAFTGVKQGNKTYSIADWNKMNKNKPTASQQNMKIIKTNWINKVSDL